MHTINDKLALLYQAAPPPARNGITKPMKAGGYSDSGADIAFALKEKQCSIITPVATPDVAIDMDWVFPDTVEGIETALAKGAKVLWLNTVLFEGHPIEQFAGKAIRMVGQIPSTVDRFDDKWVTNSLLREEGLPVPPAALLYYSDYLQTDMPIPFPKVLKPIRGRGSQGVTLVNDQAAYESTLREMFASDRYGTAVYVEPFLPGNEVTITVMPPGIYTVNGQEVNKPGHWCLPAVARFNHENGVAPYNGMVAVTHNSKVISDELHASETFQTLYAQCATAASLTGAMAPIRIDCRQNEEHHYYLFDLNMKPNMTGPARPHRKDQDSLVALAALKIGWDFPELLLNILRQAWVY